MGQLKDNCQQENTDKTMSYLMSSRVTANSSEFQLVSERPSPSYRSILEGNESHLDSYKSLFQFAIKEHTLKELC